MLCLITFKTRVRQQATCAAQSGTPLQPALRPNPVHVPLARTKVSCQARANVNHGPKDCSRAGNTTPPTVPGGGARDEPYLHARLFTLSQRAWVVAGVTCLYRLRRKGDPRFSITDAWRMVQGGRSSQYR